MTDSPGDQLETSIRKVLVIVPTYDEIDNLSGIVHRALSAHPTLDLLVVDDDSPDGTGALADRLAASTPRVQVLHRSGKQGLGAAYLAGFDWGLTHGYDVLVEMDADGSHRPEQLDRLLTALLSSDLVLGSRWVPGGTVHGWPLRRKILSRGGNHYVRLALGLPLQDATGGFRAFRATTLRSIDLGSVASHGYCFQVDLARRVLAAGLRVSEVPIDFAEREHGTSKMSGDIVREALWRVTVWGWQKRVHRSQPGPADAPASRPGATAPGSAPSR